MDNRSTKDKGEYRSSDKSFGLVFAGFFTLVTLFPLLAGGTPNWWALAVAGVFLVLALFLPRSLSLLNRLWGKFGLLLHHIMNPLVLGLLFYVIFTPMGVTMRLFGWDPMRRKWDAEAESYWLDREPAGPEPDTMKYQF